MSQAQTETRPPIWGGTQIPIIGLAGEKFSGKTLFASSIDPTRTLMIDLEKSSATYNIPYKKRFDLYDELQASGVSENPSPLDAFLWFKKTCEEIKPGEFSVLAVDPITDIEAGLADWVRQNPKQFGRSEAQYAKASGLMWADVKNWWKMFLGMLSAKVETFVFTAHMGNEWKGTSPTSKRVPKGKETLFELASLYLLVERKPDEKGKVSDAPSAIVLKSRLAKTVIYENGEISISPILPPRLAVATPKAIREYEINPPDYKKLKKSELAPEEHMSEEDLLAMRAQVAADERETEQLKLNRLEMLQQAANRQKPKAAAATMTTEAKPQATTSAGQDADGATEHDAAGMQSSPRTAAPTVQAESETEPTATESQQQQASSPEAEADDVYTQLDKQRQTMNVAPEKWRAILAKRNATELRQLTTDQATAILASLRDLWSKRTLVDMGKS